ncbi:MAG: hypothetical protein H0Z39_11955 [Peptococcaceae bacterium]|nr:hypothetical protein [Peptococcaceae bacterium]
MVSRDKLKEWLIEALIANGGAASIIEVCKYIWETYEADLRNSGDLFYTWQYEIRWAATQLRKVGIIRAAKLSPRGIWELQDKLQD